MSYVDLDGDGKSYVILKNQVCDGNKCEVFIVKPETIECNGCDENGKILYSRVEKLMVLSGEIGLTNEKYCGHKAFYEVNQVKDGVIKAIPVTLDISKCSASVSFQH